MEVLVFVAVVALAIGLTWLERKVNRAVNRKVFSRGEYRTEQELTNKEFHYPCRADRSIIRPLLDKPFSDSLSVYDEDSTSIVFEYKGLLSREFVCGMEYPDPAHGRNTAMFQFIQWSTTDGVADHTSEMKECQAWVEDVLRQADRIAAERAGENPQLESKPAEPAAPAPRPTVRFAVPNHDRGDDK